MNRRNSPCICGSNKKSKQCCLTPEGHWARQALKINVHTSKQSSLKNCYLSELNCCSDKISREHYVTEAVLNVIGDKIRVGGASWLPTPKIIGKNSLTSHVLCTDHNSSLSDLDSEAAAIFKSLKEVALNTEKGFLRLHNGYDFERWFLKTIVGMHAAGVLDVSDGFKIDGFDPSIDIVKFLEDPTSWPESAGLYFIQELNTSYTNFPHFALQPITKNNKIAGVNVSVFGLFLYVSFVSVTEDELPALRRKIYRPSELRFKNRNNLSSICLFTWDKKIPYSVLNFDFKGMNNPAFIDPEWVGVKQL